MSIEAGTVYVPVRPDMTGFGSAMTTQSRGLFGSIGTALGGMSKALIAIPIAGAIIAGIGSVVSTIGEWTKAAETAQAATRKAFTIFKNDVDSAIIGWQELVRWTTVYGNSIAMDDEAMQELMAHMVGFMDIEKLAGQSGMDPNEYLREMTRLVYDTAAALGISETAAEKMVIAINNDAERGLSLIKRRNLLTRKEVREVEKLIEAKDMQGAREALLKRLSQATAGTAKKAASESEKLSMAWENFTEWVGAKLLPIITPVFRIIRRAITNLTKGTEDWGDIWDRVAAQIKVAWETKIKPYILETWENDILPALKTAWSGFINWVADSLRGAVASALASAIPGPVGDIIGLGKEVIPGFGADGAIVTRPTLSVIGERGPEAVVPLNQMPGASPLPAMGGTQRVIITDSNLGLVMEGVLVQERDHMRRTRRAN